MTAILEALGVHNREGVEAFIEQLIAMLDDVDGDADLEPYLAGFDSETDDREEDPSDNGIADNDGMMEQLVGWSGVAL